MDMRKLVGRNSGKLRKQKGFTQEKFAEASGFTQQYISGLERGRRNPTVVTLFDLATTLASATSIWCYRMMKRAANGPKCFEEKVNDPK